jgi:hypothetical protein
MVRLLALRSLSEETYSLHGSTHVKTDRRFALVEPVSATPNPFNLTTTKKIFFTIVPKSNIEVKEYIDKFDTRL